MVIFSPPLMLNINQGNCQYQFYVVEVRAANLIEFYSSSTYFSKSEFSNLIFTSSSSTKISFFEFRQMNIQNRDNFFTPGAHAIKKKKI